MSLPHGNSAPAAGPARSSASGKSAEKVRVSVVGARGYSGAETARLLLKHPAAELVALYATQGFSPSDLLPEAPTGLPGLPMNELQPTNVVFLATPAEVSIDLAPKLLAAGSVVIDLSGGFRLKGASRADALARHLKHYGQTHPEPDLLLNAEYGLVPFASGPPTSQLIANPGCYATAVQMAMIPLVRAGLVRMDSMSVDAKSGTTGAGKKAEEHLLFAEVDGGCLPYRVGRHQHEPEVSEGVAQWGLGDRAKYAEINFSFVPHLLPVRRGIITSLHARLQAGVGESQVALAFQECYVGYKLVRLASLHEAGREAELRLQRVVGSARTVIAWHVRGDQLVVFSLIDNLLKGAASQAIENFNRVLGLPVETSLLDKEGIL